MKVQGPYAERLECEFCVSNKNGRCKTLMETHWINPHEECPFLATDRRLLKDKEILDKAIKEGRVDPKQYG